MHCTKCDKEIIGKDAGSHSRWCGYSKNLNRICKVCGKTFEHKDRRKSLCSNECKHVSIVSTFNRDDIKNHLSNKRKDYLKNNPDKHPWKRNNKFISEPCQILKDALRNRGLLFEEEFMPLEDRFFSIDIAFPAIKLGIEVNGEQHYNRDGSLKSYYQERHDLIQCQGWKIYEVHYTICYKSNRLEEIINNLIFDFNLENVDLSFEIKKKPKQTLKYGSWQAAGIAKRQITDKKYLNELDEWRIAINAVDVNKFGWVSSLAKQMNCSHTHARRIVNKYFPHIQSYKRKSRESC